MENKNVLAIPLWLLFNVESIDEIKFDAVLANNISEYELKDRKYLYSVINSISEEFKFDDIISNIPNKEKIKFSNEEIYIYLSKFKNFMEDKKFGLLIER